ncbi:phage portal protein [Ancylobacter polymorphus]|uniref:Lambda family phage portal protein n=1 Tax=Ancylobacter polymorphus TaxID=223390 RepID=A0ABU0B635_9HYPH|nr:phage portal protein [Ancylobacter polymorphus]MDQ0301281.1 lambda family phage portal protein [Ancylobacter polymorphus]
MGLIDRMRAAAHAFRSIEAGGSGQRWSRGKVLRSPAREITTRRQLAAERAAWLAMNDATAAAIVAHWATNLASDGPSIVPRTADAALRRHVSDAWSRWWDRADAEGRDDFAGILTRAARGIVAAGEAFLVMEADEAGELVLRSIAPEQVDATMTRPVTGGNIVAGIQMDARGRPTRFWIRPASDAMPAAYALTAQPVDAADVLHAFRRDHPGQVRGLSWLAPVATKLDQLAELDDSALALAQTASLFGGVLVNATGQPGDDISPASGLSPGALVELPPGVDVRFSDPPAFTGADALRREMLRSVASGVGLPYELVTADLSAVNYSSMRAGFGEFRKRVDVLRRTLVEAQIVRPLWRRWLTIEALHGRIAPNVAGSLEPIIAWSAWLPIDPAKDVEADIAALTAGLTSRAELVAKRGRDIAELDAELAADTFIPKENKT